MSVWYVSMVAFPKANPDLAIPVIYCENILITLERGEKNRSQIEIHA